MGDWYSKSNVERLRETARRFNEAADLVENINNDSDLTESEKELFDFYVAEYYSDFSHDVTVQEWNSETHQYDVDREASIARIARISKILPGRKDKVMDEDGLELTYTTASGTTFKFTTSKQVTCTRKVVGQKYIEPRTIEGRYEDIVEWECDEVVLLKKA